MAAVGLGPRATAGYRVEITRATHLPDAEQVQIEATETAPGPNCRVLQVGTSPYHLVKMDAVSTEITFAALECETRSCSDR